MSHFRHIGLVVDEMEKQIDFYKNFFGFVVQRDMFEEGTFFEHLLGVPNIKARTVKMSDDSGNIVLELLDFTDGDIPFEEKRRKVRDKGFTHFAITVKDLDITYSKLSDAKIKFVNEPRVSDDGGAKVAFCLDPENNLIELVEVL